MDYYVVINGQKQGPFDLLGFIKKVKNGVITAETLVSTNSEGPFLPAGEIPEIKDVVTAGAGEQYQQPVVGDANFPLNRILSDAVELWTRKIVEYTMAVGIILVVGILFSMTIKKVQFIADYSYIADYFTSLIIMTGLGVFAYYVLLTKRNQEVDKKEISALVRSVLPSLFAYSALTSIAVVTFGINAFTGLVTALIMLVVLTITVFVPFAITDHKVSLGRAVSLSKGALKSVGGMGALTVAVMVAMNVIAAALPSIVGNDAAFIGLVITLPITASIFAYIYDQVLA